MNESETQLKEVVLRDIESVLREKLDDHVIVENYTAKSLLPPGENYGSSIFSVHVELRHVNTGEKEDLHLIAKMVPPTEFQRRIFQSSRTFAKEIFMYDTIMPAYNKLELECGLKKNELFDVLPKFYGSRMSMQTDVDFDDDAVILMENLKVKDYYTGDRFAGYDLEHSKLAIESMARFHALGIAVKQKKPGIFEVFKMYAKSLITDDVGENLYEPILNAIKQDPEMNPYYDRCHKILSTVDANTFHLDSLKEPWISIIHSDFWVNNVMFHRGKDGVLDGIKFVDFQTYMYGSPIRDLTFFLYSSTSMEITDEQINELMDMYYEKFVETFKKMGCDTSMFSYEGYKEKFKEDAEREFVHLCFMIKVLTFNTKEIDNFNYDKMQNFITDYVGNDMFVQRLRRVITAFVKHDWI